MRTLGIAAGAAVLATFVLAMWFALPIATCWGDADGRITGGLLGAALAATAGAVSAIPRRVGHRLVLAATIYAMHALALARLAGWRWTDDELAQALVADAIALALVIIAGQRWSPRFLAIFACFVLALWWLLRVALNAFAPFGTPILDLEAQDGLLFALGAIARHLAIVWDAPDERTVRPCGPRSGGGRG